ncbi:MAG: ZIP family metal transporter [Aigarchaeota archaeon]|nr:ZIP family metal transporter [Aigarchaeota archaeon]MCX8193512.1 ZIP family metal transporter [Nitrososphaeria archaeon]MDW7986815.1 ZIP family metal transporter [Nitrososphaerota archaeon]
MIIDLFTWVTNGDIVSMGLLGGIIAALLNLAGATPVLFTRSYHKSFLNVGLGFAAGVMLAASFTSLIFPGIEYGGVLPVMVGIVLGAFAISLIDRLVPHLHFIKGREGPLSMRLKAIWLFVIAITIHNMPEGLTVGVGFGSGDIISGITLMFAIGFQNIPEGLSVGFSLISTGDYSRRRAFLVSMLSGFVEPPLAFLGAYLTHVFKQILPYFMGFAAGAMLFVVSDEIIPETHREGKERISTYGLITGLIIMLLLDVLLH